MNIPPIVRLNIVIAAVVALLYAVQFSTKIVRRIAVEIIRWGVALPLMWKTAGMMCRTEPFKSQEEAQAYMLAFLLMMGSFLCWMLFTCYAFPDRYTREDNLSRWLAKHRLSWRVE